MLLSRKIRTAREHLSEASRIFVLTGAGLSVASGIPPFRGKGGIWRKKELLRYAFPEALRTYPALVWGFYEQARVLSAGAHPNAGHVAIHALAQTKCVDVFTQNVDGLHAETGTRAREIHGSLLRYRCIDRCKDIVYQPKWSEIATPFQICPHCQAPLRHDVVLFGEAVQHLPAFRSSFQASDLILLIGTSGLVTNTWDLARQARQMGKRVIEINPSLATPATLWTTISLRAPAEKILPELVA